MSNVSRNLKLLWRSEKILSEAKLGLTSRKLVLGVSAGIAGLFACGMINLALFFAFEPEVGSAWAAGIVGALNIIVATILVIFSQNLKPAPEEDMVREVRDIALAELATEVEDVQTKLLQLRDDVQSARAGITQFVNRPMDVLTPAMIGPAIATVLKLMKSRKS